MPACLLSTILRTPARALSLSLQEWDLLVRQARAAKLLAYLGIKFKSLKQFDEIPEQAKKHLNSAQVMAEHQNRSMRFELGKLEEAFSGKPTKPIILKGAAYLAAELPNSLGRTFSDIDLLVPEAQIPLAEKTLAIHGWQPVASDDYDDHYYRAWMHELPPMKHMIRGTVIDLHHAILPRTARFKMNTSALTDSPQSCNNYTNLNVFSPEDMFIHSATHLFTDGELNSGLRDLVDLQSLIEQFFNTDDQWSDFVQRALDLRLEFFVFFGLRYSKKILGCDVPEKVFEALAVNGRLSNRILIMLADACYLRALLPLHPSTSGPLVSLARFTIYLRAHWLRMPLKLLIPHLWKKAWV